MDALRAAIERRRGEPREVVRAVRLGAGQHPGGGAGPACGVLRPARDGRPDGRPAAWPPSWWPYPPGIPALVPGEVLTAELLEALRAAAARGVRVAYAADPTMATVQVVARTRTS